MNGGKEPKEQQGKAEPETKPSRNKARVFNSSFLRQMKKNIAKAGRPGSQIPGSTQAVERSDEQA